jgi:hypothetical protein
MVGVGFLTLPVIGLNNGSYLILVMICLSSLISWFANILIGRGFRHSYGKTYAEIIDRINGTKLSLMALIFLFLYVYASGGSYYIFGKYRILIIVNFLATQFAFSIGKYFNILPASIVVE